MVEKLITSQRNVIDFARYQQGRAVVKTQAISTRCRYCGAALADGENEAEWGNVALLHDFDYERHPTLDQHPQDGAPVLREHGYPEWFVRAVLSHGSHTGVARESLLERTLFACDEISGFVHACGLVRPEGISTLTVKSVKKKLKTPGFARGVNRDDVVEGAAELGVDLDEHIAFVITALQPIAVELGLPA